MTDKIIIEIYTEIKNDLKTNIDKLQSNSTDFNIKALKDRINIWLTKIESKHSYFILWNDREMINKGEIITLALNNLKRNIELSLDGQKVSRCVNLG